MAFSVPDLGVLFRSAWKGSPIECSYVALLALLRFIELNSENLPAGKLMIFGDSVPVVQQVNGGVQAPPGLVQYRETVRQYRRRFNFDLTWIPRSENRACHSLRSIPPNPALRSLNLDSTRSSSGSFDSRREGA